jgi:hypothetical protein
VVYFVTNRIVAGLRWVAAGLAVVGVLVVVAGIGFTSSPEALVSASMIGGVAFGVPAVAAYAFAHFLDHQAAALHQGRDRGVQAASDGRDPSICSDSAWGYAIAVVSALGAWAIRMAIDRLLPGNVPFVTFFLAVAVAGWLGGFGPAVLAMVLSALIARYFYMAPVHAFRLEALATAAALGAFVIVCLGIGAITATLHSALRRIQMLSDRLAALGDTIGVAPPRQPPDDTAGERPRLLSAPD